MHVHGHVTPCTAQSTGTMNVEMGLHACMHVQEPPISLVGQMNLH
jgi:hypothetical protein